MAYTTEKVGKRHTNIIDVETGEHVCQLRNDEVRTWLFRAERSEANDKEAAIAQRAYRLEAAQAYLAKRSVRPAAYRQLELI